MKFKTAVFLAGILLAGNLAFVAAANQPRLNQILPRGGQRGTEQKFRFSGERIGEAQELFIYDRGLQVVKLESIDANNVDVTLQIAADCRLGEHVVQLRTLRGITDFRSIFVGPFPQQGEVEPNSTLEASQPINGNLTVEGTIQNEDVDYFLVEAKAGQRISVEIEAVRLGCPIGTLFDAFVAILDAERFELATCDDTPLFRQDPFVSLLAPADGKYFVMIREAAYGGNDACRYRAHIGSFPRTTAVYPAGGSPNETRALNYLGDPSGPITQQVVLPPKSEFRPGLGLKLESGESPSAMPFRLNSLPNTLEIEPNDSFTSEPVVELPQALNGVIQTPGDVDFFAFQAKKDQVWEIECYASRIGSGLDPVINIFKGSDKSHLVGNDDARGQDAYLRFQIPEDGQYFIRVMDHLRRGQVDFVYRIELAPIAPGLSLNIPRVDRYSQLLQTIAVPAGNRFATQFVGNRENFGGELQLLAASLPPGIKMTAPTMLANLNLVPVLFEADPAATPAGGLVDLRTKQLAEEAAIEGGFTNLADFANGEPNNVLYYGCSVDRLAMAITKPTPFRVEIVAPQAPLVRDGTYNLKIKIIRDPGFAETVYLQFPFRPPGVGTNYQIEAKPDQMEIEYPLNANGGAQLGKWPVYVLAGANVEGGITWISSQLAELEINEPFVKINAQRSACDQGQPALVTCAVEQVLPFEGEARVELLGLPPNTTTKPLTITKETKELLFEIATNDQSPLGQHKSLFCQVTIPVGNEQAGLATGRTELQINKPPVAPPPVAANEASPAAPQPPAAPKPMSRLEQLRERTRQAGDGSGS